MKNITKINCFLIIVLIIGTLTGCGNNTSEVDESISSETESTEMGDTKNSEVDESTETVYFVEEGSHETDVEILKSILNEQLANGITVYLEEDDEDRNCFIFDENDNLTGFNWDYWLNLPSSGYFEWYRWDENGRLTSINWQDFSGFKGDISFEGLTKLRELCLGDEGDLNSLDISKNT